MRDAKDAIVVWTKRVILNALSSHTFRYAGFGTWHAVSGMIANNHRRSHTHHTNWPFASAHDSTLHLSFSPPLSLRLSFSVFLSARNAHTTLAHNFVGEDSMTNKSRNASREHLNLCLARMPLAACKCVCECACLGRGETDRLGAVV